MRKMLSWSPVALLGLAALAMARPSAPPTEASPPPIRVGDPEKLEKALATITADSYSKDLHVIASDEYGGRDTPSEGQRKAADFIQNRLQELGFAPGYEDGYLYPYTLKHRGLVPDSAKLSIGGGSRELEPEFGVDYTLFAPSLEGGGGKGKAVWCGAGKKEDFPKSLKGHWAVIEYTPTATGRNLNRDLAALLQRAQGADAVGLLVLPEPGTPEADLDKRIRGTTERLKTGYVSYPGGRSRSRRSSRGSLPMVMLSTRAAEAVKDMMGAQGDASFPSGKKVNLSITAEHAFKGEDGTVEVHNVVGFWEGSDPKLKREVLIVSAHYDHVGWREDGEIHNGADDNGSGTCGLLALAGALKAYGPMERSILLIWVSGEEKGLFGSKAWSEKPWLPKGCRPVANLNIDMIGRNAPDKLMITPTKEGRFASMYNGLVKRAEEFRELEGFAPLESADMYYNRSDQANFAKLGIPVAFLFTDVHEDYHQVSDVPAKLDCDKATRVTRLVLRMLDSLQEKKLGV